MNLLILMAGKQRSTLTAEPSGLLSINGKTIIEHYAEKISRLPQLTQIVFVIREEDRRNFHLDSVIKLAVPKAKILSLPSATKGAACTALLCIDLLDLKSEIVVVNGDEYLETDFAHLIEFFRTKNADGGLVTFESLHPSFSFAAVASDGSVEQVAEKNPISKNATVGFYYFKTYDLLIESVKTMIRKDAQTNGYFFVSPAFNEMILNGMTVVACPVRSQEFHPLKSDLQITNSARKNF